MNEFNRAVIAALLVALGAISVALGDEARAPDNSGKLEEIVVTAQKRDESEYKIPLSITALSKQTMNDLHIESVGDLATIVPGLYANPGGAGGQDAQNVVIRGIAGGSNGATTQFYIDETPIGIRNLATAPSYSPQPYIFDLDRVEVLRGPQGTLFGASAMGGAIRFITPQPNLTDTSGSAKAEFGDTQHGAPSYEVGAAYGAPIVPGSAAFRVSAWFQSLGGFIDQQSPFTGDTLRNNANSSNAYVIRPTFTWSPSDELTITPAAFLQHKHSQNPDTYWLTELPNSDTNGHAWGGALQPLTDDLRVGSLAIKYSLPGVTLQSDSSYLDRTSVAPSDYTQFWEYSFGGTNFIPGLDSFSSTITNRSFTHAWMQEFRATSQDPSSRVTWVAGLFYRRSVQGLEQSLTDLSPIFESVYGLSTVEFLGLPNYMRNGQALAAYTNWSATDISEAAFADVTFNITSRLKAAAGVRYEHAVTEHQNQFTAGPLNGLTTQFIVLPDQVGNPVTPRFSLTYQYTDSDMVYVSASKGYRPGGGNQSYGSRCDEALAQLGLSAIPSSYNSDSLWSYEIGAKDFKLDGRLAIEASAYYAKWTGIQSQIGLTSCNQVFTANQGKAISQGFDLQIAAILAEGLKVRLLAGYTDAYYPNAAYSLPGPDGVPPPVLLNGAGDKFPNIRPWSAAANADYSRDSNRIWADSKSYLRLDYRWLGASNSLDPNVVTYDPLTGLHQDQGYNTLNIRLGIVHSGLDISLYVNNVTNADPLLSYFHVAQTSDPLYRANAIRPRTAGLTAWYHF